MPDFSNMLGKPLSGVSLSPDKERVTFSFSDGSSRSFGTDGDCCSWSWIEHLERPKDIGGAVILSVSDCKVEDATEDDTKNPIVKDSEYREHECLTVYQTLFRTDRGEISLEYRNSSNGYYGGWLTDVEG